MAGRGYIVIGAILAALAVGLGAMGAHLLEGKFTPDQLATFDTAVRYQMFHSLGLILVGLLARTGPNRWLTAAGCLFLVGIGLFSGGIYAWLFTQIRFFVHIVPIGGTLWILAWLLLAASQGRTKD